MKDLVTKGTGNSRYMKSAIGASETWEQAREKLRNGTFPFDLNGLNEAGIEQMGMALSKQNLLSDETAASLGLSGDPTVNDAFGALDYVAQYGWYREWQEWELSYGTSTQRDLWSINMYGGYSIVTSIVQYSDDLSIDEEGNITLLNPESIEGNNTNYPLSISGQTPVFAGKYISIAYSSSNPAYSNPSFFYVAEDSTYIEDTSSYYIDGIKITNMQPITTQLSETYNETLYSIDPDTYPSGEVGLSTYYPLGLVKDAIGKLGLPGTQIITGSYVGTGTSGSRGRCTLTFDFAPKMVLVYSPLSLESQAGSTSSPLILISPNNGITQGSTNTQSTQWGFNRATWSVNSVSWYADNAEHQKNMSPNYTYVYFAIG